MPTSIYQYRKYLRFHIQGRTYQFKALPFDLSTAPLEFTVVAKEVKLMALHKGIRIHHYLEDWLVRARSDQICLQHTQDGLAGEFRKNKNWSLNRSSTSKATNSTSDPAGSD